jgi:predicted TPR repeat methyltransferase
MTDQRPTSELRASEVERASEPSYHVGGRASEVVAHFGARADVNVTQSRIRAYPGLASSAPDTLTFYEIATKTLSGKHIMDAGSGAGAGTQILREHFSQVTGVEVDPRAISFARNYAEHAEFVQADLCHGLPLDRVDGATVIDLLGQVKSPETVLRNVRACLSMNAHVLVAEQRSSVSQRLALPQRRAFSRGSLCQLLLRTGFEVTQVLLDAGTFVALAARRSEDPVLGALSDGFHFGTRGNLEQARRSFAKVPESAAAELLLEARLGEAELAFASGDGDGAARAFFAANELAPRDGRGWTGLARLALATGQIEEGLRLAQEAVRRSPTDAEPNALAALAAEQLGHSSAFGAWRTAANLAPDDVAIATGLARVAAAQKNLPFAIRAFERVRDYGDALAPDFHITLAWLLLAAGRKSDAAIQARYAATVAPDAAGVADVLRAVA